MDVLNVGGKNYVKASVVARDLGYTADYVGQLCRSRKVDAQLVGRTWYVDKESIQSHRSTRYRSTKAKSQESLQETLAEKKTVHDIVKTTPTSFSSYKNRVSYIEDNSDLIPKVSKEALLPSTPIVPDILENKPLSDASEEGIETNNVEDKSGLSVPIRIVSTVEKKTPLSVEEKIPAFVLQDQALVAHPPVLAPRKEMRLAIPRMALLATTMSALALVLLVFSAQTELSVSESTVTTKY